MIQNRQATLGIDYSSRDYESFRADMIRHLQSVLPTYTDISQNDAGIVIIEGLARALDVISYYVDREANEALLATAKQRKNVLLWCNMFGYIPKSTTPSQVYQVFTLQNTQPTDFLIPKGTVISTPATQLSQPVYFTTTENLVIPSNKKGNEKGGDGNYLYKVVCKQGQQISNEVLGTSNGKKNQTFNLSYYPVDITSIKLEVKYDANSAWIPWEQVKNFIDSNYSSNHYQPYALDSDIVQIKFGDGNLGAIPPQYANGIRCSYMYGGGVVGNVRANTITSLVSNLPQISETFNPEEPFIKGTEKESLEEIRVNAPAYQLTRWGALTLSDFDSVIKENFNTVLYTKTVRNPSDFDSLKIYLMMKDGHTLTETEKQEMLKELSVRKLAGMKNIELFPMEQNNISMQASVIVGDNYVRATIKKAIEEFTKQYFAIGNFSIGESVSITQFEKEVYENIDGVYSFRVTTPNTLVIKPTDSQVVTLTSITLNVTGGKE